MLPPAPARCICACGEGGISKGSFSCNLWRKDWTFGWCGCVEFQDEIARPGNNLLWLLSCYLETTTANEFHNTIYFIPGSKP